MFSKVSTPLAGILLFLVLGPLTKAGWSQAIPSLELHEVDFAFTYSALHQNTVPGAIFWQYGGATELSGEIHRGFGAAMALTGAQAHNVDNSGTDVNTITVVFGPRYAYTHNRLSVFGEGLIGESSGFGGAYPSSQGVMSSAHTFALRTGGGLDLRLSRHFALRPIEAHWLRTQFPNAARNAQNGMQLSAGIVLRLQR